MSMFDGFRELIQWIAGYQDDEILTVSYPGHSPLEGQVAGHLVVRRAGSGQTAYEWRDSPATKLYEDVAELVIRHGFADVRDMAVCLAAMERTGSDVFVDAPTSTPAVVRCIIDRDHPAAGTMQAGVARHPAYLSWLHAMGSGEPRDLSHQKLTDILLDHREDLTDPKVAAAARVFRAVREIHYDADLGGEGHVGVKAVFKGQKAPGDLELPSEFTAQIPAYTGAWNPGQEPLIVARFTLRVMPSDGPDAAPLFRVRWTNYGDYELEARAVLVDAVRTAFGAVPVYLGIPSVTRYVIPQRTA